jgi:thymidylate kinase
MPRPSNGHPGAWILEVIGVAGAGKSTVSRELYGRLPGLLDGHRLAQRRHPVRFVATALAARAVARFGRRSDSIEGWASRKDLRYLDLFSEVAEAGRNLPVDGILFDQGPLYRLARLSSTPGEAAGESTVADSWWHGAVQQWSRLLDLVVVLDAPDPVLYERVAKRDKPHLMKHHTAQQATAFIDDFRSRFQHALTALTRFGSPRVLRFDTATQTADKIAEAIVLEYETGRRTSTPLGNSA